MNDMSDAHMTLLYDLIIVRYVTITKTYLYNFDPLKPHFYIVEMGFKGIYIISFYFCSKT